MPTTSGALLEALRCGGHDLHAVATSLYDVKCAPGFRCMSKVAAFGLGHDGAFRQRKAQHLDARLSGAYEWGCPARGAMTATGECQDTGRGATSLCYSVVRYEAGQGAPCDDPGACLCAKANTPSGDEGHGHRHSEAVGGQEVTTGSYLVMPAATAKCQECAQHDCDRGLCNACRGCEYATKTIAGRKTSGCFDVDGGAARERREGGGGGRPYLRGDRASEERLSVVRHYGIWSPGAGGAGPSRRMPYEGSREPLSKGAWRGEYRRAAPRVQRLLDQLARSAKEAWAPPGGGIPAPSAQHLDCFDARAVGGDDVAGKLEKVLSVQGACRRVQALAGRLAKGVPFDSRAEDGTPLNCVKSEGGGGDCGALNCYSADEELGHALRALRARNRQCHLAKEYLDEEEERNGPPTAYSNERSKAGRLEPERGEQEGAAAPAGGSGEAAQASAAPLLLLAARPAVPSGPGRVPARPRRRRAALREFLGCA